MANSDEIDRVPMEDNRLRRTLDRMRSILNSLIRNGVVIRTGAEDWDVNWPMFTARSGGSFPSHLIDSDGGGDDVFLRGPKGEAGATGATGPTGPAGSGSGAGSGGWPAETIGDGLYTDAGEVALSHSQQRFNLTNDAGQFLNGLGQFAVPVSSSGADLYVSATGDETVTNSTTFTSHTELQHSVTSGSVWWYQLLLLYSGNNATSDIKVNWNVSAGTVTGLVFFTFVYSPSDTFVSNWSRTFGAANWGTAHAFGTDATGAIRFGRLEYMIGYNSDATAAFQFANNAAAGAGTGCTVRAGTMLRGIRLR